MTCDRLPITACVAKAVDGDFLRIIAKGVMRLLMVADMEGMIRVGHHERTV